MRTLYHDRPETLLAVMDAFSAERVKSNTAAVVDEKRPFQLFLLGVVHLDDVTVNEHLPGVCTEILCAELCHLLTDQIFLLIQANFLADRSCAVWYRFSPPYFTTDKKTAIDGPAQKFFLL